MRAPSAHLLRLRLATSIPLFTFAYVACAYASLRLLEGNGGGAVSFWPASGISLGAFMALGSRAWPVPLLGEVLTELFFPATSPLISLMTGIGNTAETLCAYWILRRCGVRPQLQRVNHVLCMIVAIVIGAALGAGIGTLSHALGGHTPWHAFSHQAYRWWLGDALGMLIVAPFIAAWTTPRTGINALQRSHHAHLGLITLFLASLLITFAVFMPQALGLPIGSTRWIFPFYVFPFAALTALYFRFRDITLLLVLIALIAFAGSVSGFAAFPSAASPIDMVALYLFVISLISLMVYARSAEWSRTMTTLQHEESLRMAREVAQRETLVREVHHRIKNNLQGVIGILRRHAEHQPQLTDPIRTVIGQVQSIAAIYGLKGRTASAPIRLDDLIRSIAADIEALWYRRIAIDTPPALSSCTVAEAEAVPLGLVINELILNAIKHGDGFDHIKITLRNGEQPKTVRIRILNTGELPPDLNLHIQSNMSSGLNLVESLLPRQGAVLSWEQQDHIVATSLTLGPPVIDPASIDGDTHAAQ